MAVALIEAQALPISPSPPVEVLTACPLIVLAGQPAERRVLAHVVLVLRPLSGEAWLSPSGQVAHFLSNDELLNASRHSAVSCLFCPSA